MATERDKAQETYELYRYDRENGHDSFLQRSQVALQYYASKQWTEADMAARRTEKRPFVTVNEIFETVNSIAGELEQLSTDVRYQADSGDEETAEALNMLAQHVDRQNKVYIHDAQVRLNALLTGRGYYDVRMDFDDNMMGNVHISARRPQNVILPADMESADPSTWARVSTTDIVSLQDIEERFGKDAANDMRGMPIADFYDVDDRNLAQALGYNASMRTAEYTVDTDNPYIKQYRLISTQYHELKYKDVFIDVNTGDQAEVPENWPREKISYAMTSLGLAVMRKKVKTVRWRVCANDKVLHDDDSPYKYFTIVPFFPFFTDGATLSLFEILKGPQDLLNKALSEEIHILTSVASSGWKLKANSLKNMNPREFEQKASSNGLTLVLEDVGDAEKIQGQSPPTGFQDLSNRAQTWTKQLAGLTPSMQGAQRADASGDGMRIQLMRAPVNLAVPLTNFHFTKHMLAERKLNLFQTYYTETRVMKVVQGSYGVTQDLAINYPVGDRIVNDLTLGSYTVEMLPTASRMAAEEFAFDELVKLKEMGVQVPNDVLISVSSINAKADVAARLREANSGDLSPEEQMARQLELENMVLENQDKQAAVENKRALTDLSMARADRARADAQTPAARIALDANRQRLEADRAAAQESQQREKQASDVALKLTEMENENKQREEDRKTEKETAVAVAKATPKPAAGGSKTKKPAKKAATKK